MKLKKPTLKVNHEKPFENDKLNRKDNAAVLTDIINSIDEPFVLGVDGGWGMGKTTFLDMWRYDLENKDYTCLYFNAWENDYASDPLVAFIGEITTALNDAKVTGENERKAHEKIKKIKKYGKNIAARLIPTAAKLATYGILDLDKITEQTVGGAIGLIVEEQIEKYEEDKNTIKFFREALEEFAICLSVDKETIKPIIFFIDELDRCRPTYAIELLERLKHLFNVRGIIYVIAMDRVQIGHSIKSQYGSGFDSDGYLRRFFDIEYKLPEPSRYDYSRYLLTQLNLNDNLQKRKLSQGTALINTFSKLSDRYRLSLRDIGQCFTHLSIVLRSTPPVMPLHEELLSLLIVLRKGNRELYDDYVQKRVNGESVLSDITQDNNGQNFIYHTDEGRNVEIYLTIGFCKIESEFNSIQSDLTSQLNDDNVHGKVKWKIERIWDHMNDFRGEYNLVDTVSGRIESTTSFI